MPSHLHHRGAQDEFFFLSSVFLGVQGLFCSFFLLDLLKLNLICSSAGFDNGAAF